MYQNKAKIGGNLIVFSIFLILCAFLSFIMFLDILLIVTNQVPSKEEDISIASVFFGGFLFLSIVCFRKIRNAFCAGKLNRFFEKDEDGLIEIAEIARHMHMKQQKCFSFFLDCVGKGLLKNCMVFPEDPTYILLDNGKNTITEKYVVVHCNCCGAPSTLRIGFENTCKYCGAVVLEKNQTS